MADDSIKVPVTCDCGNRFEVPIGGVELDGYEFTCPACGHVDTFTNEQIDTIVAQVEAVRAASREYARKEISEALKRATRGSKVLKYTPKR